MKATLVLLLSLVLCAVAIKAPKDEFRKKLAGPPTEFSQFKIPSPVSAALASSSAFQSIELTAAKDQGFSWTGTFPVDSTSQFSLGLFSPYADSFEIVVTPPNSLRTYLHKLPLDSAEPVKRTGPFGIDGASYPVTTWTWTQPVAGTWNAEIKCTAKVDSATIKAMLLLHNESPLQVFSHLNTYDLQVGQEVGVVANLYDSRFAALDSTGRPTPMIFSSGSLKAQMDVTFPDGKEFVLQMHDDGLHSDLAANDGVYGAVLQAAEVGAYTAQAVFTGVTPSGQQFIRSTDHLFNVVEPLVTLTGLATAEMKDQNTITFHLDVDVLDPSLVDSLTVKAFAEVWGTDQSGLEYVPVAWLQAMVDPHRFQNDVVVSLQMDKNWMHLAQASAPLQLRNVWLEDRDYATPFSERSKIFVDIPASSKLRQFRPSPYMKNIAITKEMREGPKPLALRNATADNPKLILVHGYCAGENEFPTSQFTNSVQFKDFKQSRTNEAFALRIKEFAESQGITSFGIVGHSQGGLAATHLHTYYFSGLEQATGGRLVQSVGSPYGGSGLAGGLASIGGIFGVGCGSNTDLSRDGASRWRSAIPTENAKNVDFYTTIYGSQGYCAWGANMVLATPNDGTTEIAYSTLTGANNKGTTNDWCHTTGMTYANQCTDPARNAILNQNAAR